jgi:hypothetical protein
MKTNIQNLINQVKTKKASLITKIRTTLIYLTPIGKINNHCP